MRRPGPHEELTDPENENILATLTPRAWRLLNHKAVKAKFYSDYEGTLIAKEVDSLSDILFHQVLRTSGSIGGEHRKDLKDAIMGARPQTLGLGVSVAQQAESAESESGKPRRGF